ncbi:MAG: CRISPR-associated protein Cas4 [Parvularculaceae bacterium]
MAGKMTEADELIPISALQHYLYCPRQCALIHIEQQWAENRLTAEGRQLHENIDKPHKASAKGVRIVAAMPLRSDRLGLVGVADIVELTKRQGGWSAFPIEYKRGRPKSHRADEVQLCAQALCLEEMLETEIPEGAIFYGKTRRRTSVAIDAELRRLTRDIIVKLRALFDANETPPAKYAKRQCDACSLIEACKPKLKSRARAWLDDALKG